MNMQYLLILFIASIGVHIFGMSVHFASSIEQIAGYAQELEQKLQELEDEFEQLNQLPECDCKQQQIITQQNIQELKREVLMLNLHVEQMRVELPFILPIKLSSQANIDVFKLDNVLCIPYSPGSHSPYFTLKEGDHNLWYGDEGDLWGYDKQGKLFVIDKNNKRKTLTL